MSSILLQVLGYLKNFLFLAIALLVYEMFFSQYGDGLFDLIQYYFHVLLGQYMSFESATILATIAVIYMTYSFTSWFMSIGKTEEQ